MTWTSGDCIRNRKHLSKHNISHFLFVSGGLPDSLQKCQHPSQATARHKGLPGALRRWWPTTPVQYKRTVVLRKTLNWSSFHSGSFINGSWRNTRVFYMCQLFPETFPHARAPQSGRAAEQQPALWINKQELAFICHCRINLLPEREQRPRRWPPQQQFCNSLQLQQFDRNPRNKTNPSRPPKEQDAFYI